MSSLARWAWLCSLSLAGLGCPQDEPKSGACEVTLPAGSFTSQGALGGAPIRAATVISGSSGAPGLVSTQILVSPGACLCDVAKHSRDDGAPRFREDLFWISLGEPCGDAGSFCSQGPAGPGTWTVNPTGGETKVASARLDRCDGDAGTQIAATAGTVVVTGVDAAGLRGSFDLTFGAEHVTGSFEAPRCAEMGYHYAVSVDCR